MGDGYYWVAFHFINHKGEHGYGNCYFHKPDAQLVPIPIIAQDLCAKFSLRFVTILNFKEVSEREYDIALAMEVSRLEKQFNEEGGT